MWHISAAGLRVQIKYGAYEWKDYGDLFFLCAFLFTKLNIYYFCDQKKS